MPADYDDRVSLPRRLLAYASLPVYFTATVVHRLFGSREEHHLALWEDRIRYRLFLQGLPALAGTIAALVVGFVAWRNYARAETTYARQAAAATASKDYAAAEVCYTRLLGLRPEEPRYRFGLGISSAARGDDLRAVQLIAPLAPDDRIGFAPAHLWKVDRLLKSKDAGGRTLRHDVDVAEKHLIRLRDDPNLGAQARQTLMRLYLSTGRTGLVVDDAELRQAAESEPETRLAVLQERILRGERSQETGVVLEQLVRDFTARLRADRDDRAARTLLCKTLALSGDLRTAVSTAEEGMKLDSEGPFGALTADLMTARAAQVRNGDGLTDGERRNVYRRALDLMLKYAEATTANDLKIAELANWLGANDEVERRYLKAAEKLPPARLQLADFYVAVGRPDDAQAQWRLVAERYAKLESAQQANVGERLLAATAAQRQGRYEDAEQLLFVPEPTAAVVGLRSRLYVEWSDSLAKQAATAKNDATAQRLALLRKGLRLDPWNPALLQRLLQTAEHDAATAAEIRTFLLGMIADGNVPAAAYLLLGTDALQRGDRETAMNYLNQAFRLRPEAVDVLNNLAWALLTDADPQPERALELATAALQRAPKDARVLDTRFRIYAKLGRWNEALTDLEGCAAAMTGNREFHLAAAEVYDHVKLPAVAAEHRRRAEIAKPAEP